MSRDTQSASTQFFAGRVCLDFANTMDWRTSEAPQELIADYAALLKWSAARHTLSSATIRGLKALAAANPRRAAAVTSQSHALRSEMWKAADALSRGDAAVVLDVINSFLESVPAQPRLIWTGAGCVHDLPGSDLKEPLRPVIWSLSALLCSDDARRIGCCQGHGCGWFFVDESPNRTRVWCSNDTCGNRARARRAYARRRAHDV